MSHINERIFELRKSLKLSRTAFGEPLAASDSVNKNIENNLTEPKPSFLSLICRTYGVSQTWLETGEGDMFEPQTQDEELAQLFGDLLGDPDDTFKKRFISALLQLDSGEWGKIEQFCRTVIDSRDEKKEDG